MAKYRPDLAAFTSTGQPGTTGDALDLVQKIGAEMFDLDQIQIHPTQAVGAKTLVSETVRGAGAILANGEGKRFVTKSRPATVRSAAVLRQTDKFAFVVFDEGSRGRWK